MGQENDLDDCLILNEDNQVIESTRSNLFLYVAEGQKLITPEKDSGALKGIMQKKVGELSEKLGLDLQERPISPFDVLKADEVWLTNSLRGVQSVRQYKKQSFGSEMAQKNEWTDRASVQLRIFWREVPIGLFRSGIAHQSFP